MAKIAVVLFGVIAIIYAVTGKSLKDIPTNIDEADANGESKLICLFIYLFIPRKCTKLRFTKQDFLCLAVSNYGTTIS